MVWFVSLFVGLVLGIVEVELRVGAGVDRVELLLDGRPIAELREPFSAQVDLGCEPAPHDLVAVARDAEGREVGRARQWINRPRGPAEASLVLDGGSGGRDRHASLVWNALADELPRTASATLDGVSIPLHDPSWIALPEFDPDAVHLLRADLDFGGGVAASAETVFGGSAKAEAATDLTAVLVELEKGGDLPGVDALAGWLEADGRLLEVAAVEAPGADVVFVAEGSVREELQRAYERLLRSRAPASRGRTPFAHGAPGEDLRFLFLWPVARVFPREGSVVNLYPTTPWFRRERVSVDRIAGFRLEWPAFEHEVQRIADAVAVAGLAAARGGRRRAVVLLLGPGARDGGRLVPDEAIRFLGLLGVPLRVWSVGTRSSPEATRWRAASPLLLNWGIGTELESLLSRLALQRVVWVAGAPPPGSVALTPHAKGVRLVH